MTPKNTTQEAPGPLRAASVSCPQAAKILSSVYGEAFTPEHIRAIAAEAGSIKVFAMKHNRL
ncbi:MAG: hypothetical protein K8S55_15700 [Phycisphaerae bacterium]|nr:hypothetical protein [Phycisphaerae bacterium]